MVFVAFSMRATLLALVSSALVVKQTFAAPGDTCAEAIPFCPVPQLPGTCGDGIFELGMPGGFDATNAGGRDITDAGIWYKLTVKMDQTTCLIHLGFDTCEGAPGFDSDLEVYESCADASPTWKDEDSCPNEEDAIIEINHLKLQPTLKTFWVFLKPRPDSDIDSGIYSIQGDLKWKTGCHGDPHFYRWNHAVRDSFHGECDMVLMHKENIVEGMDFDVHIRTTIRDSYSYIEAAAVKIGQDRIEFQKNGVYVNGEKKEEDEFPLNVGVGNQIVKDLTSIKPRYAVKILDKVAVEVKSTKQFMTVEIAGSTGVLDDSMGVLGDHKTGDMVARDGSILDDFEQFAFDWQVNPTDPKIFMDDRQPQLPYERCRMPSVSAESRRRKLRGQDRKLYEQAVAACNENHIPENIQSCIDDVMFTGELDLAEAF